MLFVSPPLKIAVITVGSQSAVSWDGRSILKTLAWHILTKSNNVVQIHLFLIFFFLFLTSFSFFGFPLVLSVGKLYPYF